MSMKGTLQQLFRDKPESKQFVDGIYDTTSYEDFYKFFKSYDYDEDTLTSPSLVALAFVMAYADPFRNAISWKRSKMYPNEYDLLWHCNKWNISLLSADIRDRDDANQPIEEYLFDVLSNAFQFSFEFTENEWMGCQHLVNGVQ